MGRRPPAPSPVTHPDIFRTIISFADKPTLARCMLVSWSTYDMASPLLYNNVVIVPQVADSFLHGASYGPIFLDDGSSRELKRELLAHVKVLGVKEHRGCTAWGMTACTRWHQIGIEFPALEVLRIWIPPQVYEGGWFGCPWVSTFTPRTLVVRDCTAVGEGNSHHTTSSAPSSVLPSVRKVVETVRELRDLSQINDDVIASRKRTPPSCYEPGTEAVVVFWVDSPEAAWCPDAELSGYDNIISQITICALRGAARLTICNAGLIQRVVINGVPTPYEEREYEVETAVREKLKKVSERRAEQGRLGARLKALRFMPFGEYLREGTWEGEFDVDEVGPWLS
ncbi:hypothetical protein IAT38_002290 [Cryptococcus sp. DSM 104549]